MFTRIWSNLKSIRWIKIGQLSGWYVAANDSTIFLSQWRNSMISEYCVSFLWQCVSTSLPRYLFSLSLAEERNTSCSWLLAKNHKLLGHRLMVLYELGISKVYRLVCATRKNGVTSTNLTTSFLSHGTVCTLGLVNARWQALTSCTLFQACRKTKALLTFHHGEENKEFPW